MVVDYTFDVLYDVGIYVNLEAYLVRSTRETRGLRTCLFQAFFSDFAMIRMVSLAKHGLVSFDLKTRYVAF